MKKFIFLVLFLMVNVCLFGESIYDATLILSRDQADSLFYIIRDTEAGQDTIATIDSLGYVYWTVPIWTDYRWNAILMGDTTVDSSWTKATPSAGLGIIDWDGSSWTEAEFCIYLLDATGDNDSKFRILAATSATPSEASCVTRFLVGADETVVNGIPLYVINASNDSTKVRATAAEADSGIFNYVFGDGSALTGITGGSADTLKGNFINARDSTDITIPDTMSFIGGGDRNWIINNGTYLLFGGTNALYSNNWCYAPWFIANSGFKAGNFTTYEDDKIEVPWDSLTIDLKNSQDNSVIIKCGKTDANEDRFAIRDTTDANNVFTIGATGSVTGNGMLRGSDAFGDNKTADTVEISGATASDYYYVTAVDSTPAGYWWVVVKTDTLIVNSSAAEDDTPYYWLRLK